MPLTLSHPAAAIPLRRLLGRLASLPALILGSMAPDFPYYAFVTVPRTVTHTLGSVFWFSVPATLVAFVLFDRLLRTPLLFLLPVAVRCRIPERPPRRLTPGTLLAVCVSGAVGAATHLAWDSFTHAGGAAVTRFAIFRTFVVELGGLRFPLYDVLQFASTVAGVALMLVWVRRWIALTPPQPLPAEALFPFSPGMRPLLLCAGILAGVATGVAAGVLRIPHTLSAKALQTLLRAAVVAGVAAMLGVLLLFALAWRLRARPSRPE
jgi:hypothetical protein